MSSLPHSVRFKPAAVALNPLPEWTTTGTPFDFAYWQAFNRNNVRGLAATLANDHEIDPRAGLYIEPVLRWAMSERSKPQREPVVVCHDDLLGADAPADRAAIGDGVLLVVACQVLLHNEAWQTYRELCTTQPVAAAIGTIVASDRPAARAASLDRLSDVARERRAKLASKLSGGVGEALFSEFGSKYPTSLDMLAATPAIVISSQPTTAVALRADATQPREMTMDAIISRMAAAAAASQTQSGGEPMPVSTPVTAGVDSTPALPTEPVSTRSKHQNDVSRETLQRSVLRNKRYQLNIILRGYVSRAVVRSSPRLQHNGRWFYVLQPSAVRSTAERALADTAPEQAGVDVLSTDDERPTATDTARSVGPSFAAAADDDNDDGPRVDASIAEVDLQPQPLLPPRARHLLDRLRRLDLARLTVYEIDRSARDRFSVHAALYAFWRTNTNELPNRTMVCLYPRGYNAPVAQADADAPGLLATAKPFDYAAIGLASLCIAAAMDGEFRAWLLLAEAYLYRLRTQNVEPRDYVQRIDDQVRAVTIPPADSELARLMRALLVDAHGVIHGIDEHAIEESDSDDDGVDDDDDESGGGGGDDDNDGSIEAPQPTANKNNNK